MRITYILSVCFFLNYAFLLHTKKHICTKQFAIKLCHQSSFLIIFFMFLDKKHKAPCAILEYALRFRIFYLLLHKIRNARSG